MKTRADRILRLATQVTDGVAVDWQKAEMDASDEVERDLVRRLKTIAAIGELHRRRILVDRMLASLRSNPGRS
jgi:hypothetical protein